MTARTSQKLADALSAAGFEDLAKRAEADEFHDFLSNHDLPDIELDRELTAIIRHRARSPRDVAAATDIRERHHRGEFDADKAESDEWWEREGKEVEAELIKALKEGKA